MLPLLVWSYSVMMDDCPGTGFLICFWQLPPCCTETLQGGGGRVCPRPGQTRDLGFLEFPPPGQVRVGARERDQL